MKALVLAPFSAEALIELQRTVAVLHEDWQTTRRLHSPQELASKINGEGVGVLIVEADFVFDEVFESAPGLSYVGVCRSTPGHVDLDAATRHGVAVVYAPKRNAAAVAELTLGLMISLARGIPQKNRYVKDGQWEDPVGPYIGMRGTELGGKTLGILGVGIIGKSVARMAEALGMKVVGYDPFARPDCHGEMKIHLTSLEQVLKEADFVSIHSSGDSGGGYVLDSDHLHKLKKGAYLINTADCSALDEAALVALVESGHIAGAALDVHVSHPIPPNSPFLKLDNVILTPHIGGATRETIERHSWTMVEELRRFLEGKRPLYLANPEVWESRA